MLNYVIHAIQMTVIIWWKHAIYSENKRIKAMIIDQQGIMAGLIKDKFIYRKTKHFKNKLNLKMAKIARTSCHIFTLIEKTKTEFVLHIEQSIDKAIGVEHAHFVSYHPSRHPNTNRNPNPNPNLFHSFAIMGHVMLADFKMVVFYTSINISSAKRIL